MGNFKLKNMALRIYLLAGYVTASITPYVTPLRYDCSKAEYNRCVNLADPLVREPNLIFPDNMDDINAVCQTWSQFVDCLRRYTDNCFTDQQRKIFNNAVANPIESVHKMCKEPTYQLEYLQYAPCIKSTVTKMSHCGVEYSLLVEQVSKGDAISRASLCCSHHRFKQCIFRETQRLCDNGIPNGNAVRFSSQIIDKALNFLQEQCYNYIPNSGDCPITSTTIDQLYTGSSLTNDIKSSWRSSDGQIHSSVSPTNPGTISGGSSVSNVGANTIPDDGFHQGVVSSGNSQSGQSNGYEEKSADGSQNNGINKPSTNSETMIGIDQSTEVSWLPTHSSLPDDANNKENRQSTIDFMPSGRTRPSSYGRSSSWLPSQEPTESTVRPSWATPSTWHIYSKEVDEQQAATERWTPLAGSYPGNSVDEPNQLGLSNVPDNSGIKISLSHIDIAIICSINMVFLIINLN